MCPVQAVNIMAFGSEKLMFLVGHYRKGSLLNETRVLTATPIWMSSTSKIIGMEACGTVQADRKCGNAFFD
jgi:hypothetical protein